VFLEKIYIINNVWSPFCLYFGDFKRLGIT